MYQTILEYVTTVGCENEETYCDGPGDGQFPDVSRPVKRDKPRKIEADVVERGPVRAIESDVTEEHGIDLHEAALDAGGTAVLRFISGEGATYPNVDELAKRSDLIVVGRTISNRNLMQVDGKFITESVWVAVQEVIKGNLKTGSRIPITVPGGAHEFPDGSFVVLKPADAAPPHDGQTCIFFLQNPRQGHKERTTTGEFQGLYYFSAGTISAADQIKNDPVVEKYSGMRVSAFLAAVHRAAGGPSTSRRAAERIGIRRK